MPGSLHPSRRARLPMLDGQRFSVYALIEDGKIRYVGITSQTLARRLNQHFQDMNRPYRKEHKTNWLRACKRDGLLVIIKSLRSGLVLGTAQRIERQIIKRLRPQLVNVHDGGSSGYAGLPPESKAKHSASMKRLFSNPYFLERMQIVWAKVRESKLTKKRERIAYALLHPTIKPVKQYRFNLLMRDKTTGEIVELPLKSVRDAVLNLKSFIKTRPCVESFSTHRPEKPTFTICEASATRPRHLA